MTAEPSKDEKELLDFYQRLRRRIRGQLARRRAKSGRKNPTAYERLVGFLALLPDLFHLAVKLLFDRSVPARKKAVLVATVMYVVTPIDIIPDVIPVVGWLDDLVVLALGLRPFLDSKSEAVRAAVTRHWAGDQDVFEAVQHILAAADAAARFLPKKFMNMVRRVLK
jgi:uncharacterized membrane protein YkvA (DUF1232 family)